MGVAKVSGEENRLLRIITAYRPKEPGRHYTVYVQHQAYYTEKKVFSMQTSNVDDFSEEKLHILRD